MNGSSLKGTPRTGNSIYGSVKCGDGCAVRNEARGWGWGFILWVCVAGEEAGRTGLDLSPGEFSQQPHKHLYTNYLILFFVSGTRYICSICEKPVSLSIN